MNPSLQTYSKLLITSVVLALLAGCTPPQATAGLIQVYIDVDGVRTSVSLPAGSTVQQSLDAAQIQINPIDRIEPPGYTVLTDGAVVKVTHLTEKFEVETVIIPFERQTIRNEGLPEGETRLLQPGKNGIEEITYRIVKAEGIETSRTPARRIVVHAPQPEIVMIGAQPSYAPITIEGTLAYIAGGNAWIINGNTGSRKPLIVTGDLDGHVFQLSPDSLWLLYSRRTSDEDVDSINSLWLVSTTESSAEPIDLKVKNVINFAAWFPSISSENTVYRFAYSTAEPRTSAPGWQANNNLILATINMYGRIIRSETLIPANAGGQYGWWGTSFAWSPDGAMLAYARADEVGLVNPEDPSFDQLYQIVPFETLGDWAWVPEIAWDSDSRFLLIVDHGFYGGLENPETSPIFNLLSFDTYTENTYLLVQNTGMFAYPAISPIRELGTGENARQITYLQAIDSFESAESHYRLMIMDRDGSNVKTIFPSSGEIGLKPHPPAWSPDGIYLAIHYRGDLWIVEALTGDAYRLTGNGQISAFSWGP